MPGFRRAAYLRMESAPGAFEPLRHRERTQARALVVRGAGFAARIRGGVNERLNDLSLCGRPLERLPLVTLYLSERCNSRCVTCDFWRHGHADMTLERVARLAPSLTALGTEVVLISGGEPLVNREWLAIADLLRSSGFTLWLLTSGLSLVKHAATVARRFDRVTVSLDGACAETYAAIRGVDAFDHVLAGIRAAAAAGAIVTVRATVQRANFRELPALVDVARAAGARQISFLAVDAANPHAFARRDERRPDVSLHSEDLPQFERILSALARSHASDFASGFIAESPRKLARLLEYFAAVCGLGPFPQVRCNAPEFSAVVDARGRVQPCFFIPGPPAEADRAAGADVEGADFLRTLNAPAMRALRSDIHARRRPECATCVCSMWREVPG